jgi:hypothetical protein
LPAAVVEEDAASVEAWCEPRLADHVMTEEPPPGYRVVFVMTPEWMAFKRFVEEYELVQHLKSPERVVVTVNRMRRHVTEHRRALRLLEEAVVRSVVVHMPEDRRP